jgi:hypothetical protein
MYNQRLAKQKDSNPAMSSSEEHAPEGVAMYVGVVLP